MPQNDEALSKAFVYDCGPYFTHYPFMSRDPGGELDGNAILYAGTYGVLFQKLFKEYRDADEHSSRIYAAAYVAAQPGIITRGPDKLNEPQTHDDYIGLCSLSNLGNGGVATVFYNYGKNHWWSFFRKGQSLKDWFNDQFWRLPGVVQHIKLCASEKWNIFDSLWWALGVYASSFSSKDNSSGAILTWHMVTAYLQSNEKHWLCDLAVAKWKAKIIAKYPNAMGDVFRIYYGIGHPFTKWAQGL